MASSPPSFLLAALTCAIASGGAAACSEESPADAAPASLEADALRTPPEADAPRASSGAAAPPAAVVEAAHVTKAPAPAQAEADAPPAAATTPPASAAAEGARIYSKARFAWINPGPYPTRGWSGYLGLGGSVALRGGSVEAARTPGEGCDAWYAIEPRGYVCAGASAAIDPNDPVVAALRPHAPKVDSPWPYDYAESTGAPRYPQLPSAKEQRRSEWDLEEHLANIAKVRAAEGAGEEAIREIDEALVGVDLKPAGVAAPALFPFGGLVREGRDRIVNGSTVAFTRAFDAQDRTWVVTSDQAYMPKDRLKPYPRSSFQGVWLKDGRSLPLAFFRKTDRPKYQRGAGGRFEPTGASFARLASVGLTGRAEVEDGERLLETQEPGVYVRADDAVVIEAAKRSPLEGDGDPSSPRKWIEVSVLGGWFVAYEELTPVFATLISPGRGGVPRQGIPAIETAATPTGRFRIDGKFVTATMVSSTNDKIVHSEVQFVQNFSGPHALHGAYWHDAWGEPKSGGCVNLSPIDAKQMFAWTDPPVPEGWHGLRASRDAGRSTVVLIHR
ncbi:MULTISPECIES: L,D-transpeptidase [Sorangium]|uniref:Piccolo protein n=1 Tax=Sorangium cellulosum (strain So ce56) TaxID=448385 RepID=A9G6X7_SORC5|nr:L,D-transpeptidase [Sorangium cellulosum]CAN92751.1 Piccolo protein [Sorangium cellulosum So ce56]